MQKVALHWLYPFQILEFALVEKIVNQRKCYIQFSLYVSSFLGHSIRCEIWCGVAEVLFIRSLDL